MCVVHTLQAPDGKESNCPCTDRKKIKIGGVTHGIDTDRFWDPVFAASMQAAIDMNVELLNERFDASDNQGSEVLHTRMANRITELCNRQDVDGIFVSIPSDIVKASIQSCLDLNIPVISVNAGVATSEEMGLDHHIGMLEYNAGKEAGVKLIQGSSITSGVCANHAKGVSVVEERCAGFAAALEDAGLPYIGEVYVPDDNEALYIENVEASVNEIGDWTGVGLLATGGPQHIPAISLQKLHPGVKIGVFDVSPELYEALDAGKVSYGIDQEPWLQGYMPVIFLTYAATIGQDVTNRVIESGPAFVLSSPSEEQIACEEVFYQACEAPAPAATEEASQNQIQSVTNSTGLIVGICILAAALVLMGAFFVYRMNAVNKRVAELEAEGKKVRRVSMSQRALSLVKPLDQVIEFDEAGEKDVEKEDSTPREEAKMEEE